RCRQKSLIDQKSHVSSEPTSYPLVIDPSVKNASSRHSPRLVGGRLQSLPHILPVKDIAHMHNYSSCVVPLAVQRGQYLILLVGPLFQTRLSPTPTPSLF